jgi:hypothetical protein
LEKPVKALQQSVDDKEICSASGTAPKKNERWNEKGSPKRKIPPVTFTKTGQLTITAL